MNVFVLKKMLMDTAEADYGWIYLFIPLHIYIYVHSQFTLFQADLFGGEFGSRTGDLKEPLKLSNRF